MRSRRARLAGDPTNRCTDGGLLVRNSLIYREFEAERAEIMRHKWIESEKAGHDIGFEAALTDWILKHRTNWRKTRQIPPTLLHSSR